MQCAITGFSSIPSTDEEKKNIKKGKGNRKGNVKGSRKMKMEKEKRIEMTKSTERLFVSDL